MAATHCRIVADIPLSKDRKLGAIIKLTDAGLKAWQTVVEELDGTVEIDAVTIAKRKAPTPPPGTSAAPTADLADLAQIGTAVADAAKTPHVPPIVGMVEGRHGKAAA